MKTIQPLFLAATLFLGMPALLSAADAPADAAALSSKLFAALEKGDYEAFIAEGDQSFKTMTKEQFTAASAQVAPKIKNIKETIFLGELNQKGYRVTLWKLTFKDGGDDSLATMSIKDGKAAGFLIK